MLLRESWREKAAIGAVLSGEVRGLDGRIGGASSVAGSAVVAAAQDQTSRVNLEDAVRSRTCSGMGIAVGSRPGDVELGPEDWSPRALLVLPFLGVGGGNCGVNPWEGGVGTVSTRCVR